MNMKTFITWITLMTLALVQNVEARVTILTLNGDVTIRRGVEEKWQSAEPGMILEDIDTILTGHSATAKLETSEGTKFNLLSDAMLDISDLRKITEEELFLFLTAKKIKTIQPRDNKTRLRIGNVSVIHGLSKAVGETIPNKTFDTEWYFKEKNGARSLYLQEYYPNAIVKLHKILSKYNDNIVDCSEIHFYLGKSFEALNKPGQARDAYQLVINNYNEETCTDPDAKVRFEEAQKAIRELK